MNIITPEFVDRVIETGPLAEARRRTQDGLARPKNNARWEKFSSWALICEEILDTAHPADWYDDIIAELGRRGLTFEQIDVMLRFAWETVGWLNYDKVLWEWVTLDEEDIKLALDWQLREGRITQQQYAAGLAFLARAARSSQLGDTGTVPFFSQIRQRVPAMPDPLHSRKVWFALLAVCLAPLCIGQWLGWFWPNQFGLIVLFLFLMTGYGYGFQRLQRQKEVQKNLQRFLEEHEESSIG